MGKYIRALFGIPFCSYFSIPIFMGITFSFLISSPLVDVGSLVWLMSIFDWKIAIAYVIVGPIISVVGGSLIAKLHMKD